MMAHLFGLKVYRPRPASAEDMQAFHAEDYIEFLQNVSPDNKVWSMPCTLSFDRLSRGALQLAID